MKYDFIQRITGRRVFLRSSLGGVLAAVLAVSTGAARASEPITAKNWVGHPHIVEVRNIYEAVQKDREAGLLVKKERGLQPGADEPQADTLRVLHTDKTGRPRIYYTESGPEGSTVRRELFYDAEGNLRFALITAAVANGTRIEHRIYFSADGTRIWEDQKKVKGPGHPFPAVWPDRDLPRDPAAAFKAQGQASGKKQDR